MAFFTKKVYVYIAIGLVVLGLGAGLTVAVYTNSNLQQPSTKNNDLGQEKLSGDEFRALGLESVRIGDKMSSLEHFYNARTAYTDENNLNTLEEIQMHIDQALLLPDDSPSEVPSGDYVE